MFFFGWFTSFVENKETRRSSLFFRISMISVNGFGDSKKCCASKNFFNLLAFLIPFQWSSFVTANLVLYECTIHIETDCHFIFNKITSCNNISTMKQLVDLLTKALGVTTILISTMQIGRLWSPRSNLKVTIMMYIILFREYILYIFLFLCILFVYFLKGLI